MKYLTILMIVAAASLSGSDPVAPKDCKDLTPEAKWLCCWAVCPPEDISCMAACVKG